MQAEPPRPERDRYEPLPSLPGIPGWVWRHLPPAGRVALALIPIVVVALVVLLGPGIDRAKVDRRQAEVERKARVRAERVAALRAEQRPHFASGVAAGSDLAARAALLGDVRSAVEADARRRVTAGALDGPIRRVACEPYPRSLDNRGAHLSPTLDSGRYACLAVTRDVAPSERAEAATVGHPYRVSVDFRSGRYALCKVSGRAGEGAIGTEPLVAVPRACGGR